MQDAPGLSSSPRGKDLSSGPAGTNATTMAAGSQAAARRAACYVWRLWRGEFSLARVFWTDMLVVGTLVNVATLLITLLAFGVGAPAPLGVAIFLAPLPYNLLLFMGVWRSAARENSQWSWPAQTMAVMWLVAMLLI